ncbi:hypothetical protein AHF37_08069 [Paragonimus kellicotti]|nr:hypothetical protein AHF37_08069 [Paragonimus kellicotti]
MHIEMTLVEQLDEVINEFNRNMKDMIDTFLEKVETAKELENNTDTIMIEYTIKDYIERVQKLRYDLMHIEMTLVEQLDEVINEFNRNMKDMIDTFLEKVEEHFAECREQQSQFNERLTDISPSVLDRFLRTDSDVIASDDLLAVSLYIYIYIYIYIYNVISITTLLRKATRGG